MTIEAHHAFREQVARPDNEIDLLRAATLIAQPACPDLDTNDVVDQIDAWAERLRGRGVRGEPAAETLRCLNAFMFDELGFRGDLEDYYDPRNSYINEVLQRRQGLPIALSVVYMALGRRVGLDLFGVSFPSHFLVRLGQGEPPVIIDTFSSGMQLDEPALRERLRAALGRDVADTGPWLETATNREILIRMLSNLKAIFTQGGDAEKAVDAINRILLIDPSLAEQYRDRGLLYHSLDHFEAAAADLGQYLKRSPEAEDADVVGKLLFGLQDDRPVLH